MRRVGAGAGDGRRTAPPARGSVRGFTLVELLVVLVIVSLITALASPMIASVLPGYQLKNTATDVEARLRSARANAIGTNQPVGFYVDVANRTYGTGAESRKSFADGISAKFVAARSLMPSEDTGQVRFFADGTSSGGQLTLTSNGRGITLVIDWFDGRVNREE